jgi:DNA-binding NtrC family response regulator
MSQVSSSPSVSENVVPPVGKGSKRLWAICRAAERTEIARALVENGHNRTHAANALGISRRTLLNKIKAYGLTRLICRQLAQGVPPATLWPAPAPSASPAQN